MGFVAVVLTVLVLMHGYVYLRAVHGVFPTRRGRLAGGAVVALLAVATVAAFVTRRTPDVSAVVPYVGYVWLGVLLYVVLLLAVGELVRLGLFLGGRRGLDPSRRRLLSAVVAGTAVAGAVAAIGYGILAARRVRVERREIVLDRLDPAFDGFTIAAVSDIHLGPFVDGGDLARIVATINREAPDAVAVVGDLVDGGVADLGPAAAPLRDLAAPAYFVTGNHEYFSDAADWVAYLPTLGVRVLRNSRETLRRGDAVLHIAGCDDRTAATSGVVGHGFDLDAALHGRAPDEPVVLLCHQPVMVDRAARAGVDLQISGHTHGGQLWPITHVALIDQPVLSGLVRVGPTWLYVTRGTGFWGPPARVGSPPEITVLVLRAGSSS
ncbi:metallophosphoesterase [Pseudonocardia sp.]|uniref:metallophosphoesterase n=1 Tax=Pseudonocardia sp. TaxID=60912 RepID=UPI003D0E6099